MGKSTYDLYPTTISVRRDDPRVDFETTHDIRCQLRQCLNGQGNVVVTRRASGKTTGLLQFVAERTMQLGPEKRIAVFTPNENIGQMFLHLFDQHFPRLRRPLVASYQSALRGSLDGQRVDEAYVEEMFLIPFAAYDELAHRFPVKAGVGTIEQPTLLKVVHW